MLEALGFQHLPGGSVSLSCSLAGFIPAPSLPPGFQICPSKGEPEAAEWVKLHRLAWGTENMTVEERLSMLRTPYYDPALDLVALDLDGSLAAYCVCWFSEEENALTGLRLLKEKGLETACMGTAQENLGMLHTAEAVGFHSESETVWFSKTLSAS
jgi:mycothiol synthase